MTTRITLDIGIALLVFIPLTLFLGARIGEGVPFLLAIVIAAIMAFVVPRVPGSPIACLDRHPAAGNPCAGHMTWIWVLNIAAPLGIAAVAGEVRDHRRRGRR
jgi:hypothetical protein